MKRGVQSDREGGSSGKGGGWYFSKLKWIIVTQFELLIETATNCYRYWFHIKMGSVQYISARCDEMSLFYCNEIEVKEFVQPLARSVREYALCRLVYATHAYRIMETSQ